MQKPFSLSIRGRLVEFTEPPVMGIVNITPDSFYADSRSFGSEAARSRVARLLEEGAAILDLGGYSSRPGASEVSPDEEYTRLARGLEAVRDVAPDAIVSVDTFRAGVARRCVEEWDAGIVNDIGGGDLDPEMWETVAGLGVAYVLMHLRGTPATMQGLTDYSDVVAEVLEDLARKTAALHALGVADVIVDPGFGFAKTVEQNYALLSSLELFRTLGCPVLAGLSHKSMIWRPLGITPAEALPGTIALDTVALLNGADILRVHDVKEAVQTVSLMKLLRECAPARTTINTTFRDS